MDAISLVQTVIPLIVAIIFSSMSVVDVKGLVDEKAKSVLAPLWCFIAFLGWIFFGIVNLYATTSDYLSNLAWLYIGIGLIFFPVLFLVALLMNLKVSAKLNADEAEVREMEMN
jgi:hypothetical protein